MLVMTNVTAETPTLWASVDLDCFDLELMSEADMG